ncbi:MAG: hypothetical protein EA349_10205 [Halomonadaceae bacterium]|nr:MAG: hypothetical protein EA349_10205 [Halomonadaceae bacterium]
MIDSKWHMLVQEKLTLARSLFRQMDQGGSTRSALEREALRQGGVFTLVQARLLLLQHIARTCQHKEPELRGLEDLQLLLGEDHAEYAMLEALREERGGWWQTLDNWTAYFCRPKPEKKKPQPENIIAVAQDTGPDLSPSKCQQTVDAMAATLADFSERHGEW